MEEIKRGKHKIDAAGKAVGRVATEVATLLRGKNKPTFEPHIDAGDFVTIVNAGQVKFTGKKFVQKDFFHHTMYPGGLRREALKTAFDNDPTSVMKRAVYGMLPKNRLRDLMIKRLTIKA